MTGYKSPRLMTADERHANFVAAQPLMYLDKMWPSEQELVANAVREAVAHIPAWMRRRHMYAARLQQ